MKKKTNLAILLIASVATILFIAFVVTAHIFLSTKQEVIFISLAAALMLLVGSIIVLAYYIVKKRKEDIKESFDYYMSYLVSDSGLGFVVFNEDNEIIWASKFILQRSSGVNLIGKKIQSLSPSFKTNFELGHKSFRFLIDKLTYAADVHYENKVIVIKDVSAEEEIRQLYTNEKLVLGELEIDNFQQYQLILPQEELFRIQSKVINMLDELIEKYNLTYRQYVNGKYIIITTRATLEQFKATQFDFLDQLRKITVVDGVQLSVSIGFGVAATRQNDLLNLAKEGLLQAQARGGDQVTISHAQKKPEYFGSKAEGAASTSKVKIKQISEHLADQLIKENIKKVIIYGHKYADLDAIGSAMGMKAIADAYGKEVYIQNMTYDKTTDNALKSLLSKEDFSMFINPAKAQKLSNKKDTLAIIVDVADLNRIENPKLLDDVEPENVFIFDHHRIIALPERIPTTNQYIDTTASSASEIVVEVIQFQRRTIYPKRVASQMMLNGIYLDTNQFQKSTSARTFQAASFLEGRGASSLNATSVLKVNEVESKIIQNILARVEEVRPGFYVSAYEGEANGDTVSKAADEILRTAGRKAAFVIAKVPGVNRYKMSARGIETNVQVVAEKVGGGGHFSAAAAESKEPLNIFKDNLMYAINTTREKSKK